MTIIKNKKILECLKILNFEFTQPHANKDRWYSMIRISISDEKLNELKNVEEFRQLIIEKFIYSLTPLKTLERG